MRMEECSDERKLFCQMKLVNVSFSVSCSLNYELYLQMLSNLTELSQSEAYC